MKFAFSGYYGMRNFGDDLFVAACEVGKKFCPAISQAVYVSPEIPGVRANYLCPTLLARIYAERGGPGAAVRLMTQLRGRLASDVFVFAGGSLFKGISASRRIGSLVGTLTRRREAAIGVSIGPFENVSDERAVAEYLKRMEYISVRDTASEQWLLSQDIDVPASSCGDLVGCYPFEISPRHSRVRKVLGISLAQSCRFEPGDNSVLGRFYKSLVLAIKHAVIEVGCEVEIFDLNGNRHGDTALTNLLRSELEEIGVKARTWSRRNMSSLALALKIGQCDAFLSGRLHGAVVSYLFGIPFALVEYEQKCAEFLNDIGQDNYRRLPFPDASPQELQTRLLNLFACSSAPCRSPSHYRQRSLGHFTLAPWSEGRASL